MNITQPFLSQLTHVNEGNFDDIALSLFHYQSIHNTTYRTFIETLGLQSSKITSIDQIPFLPIEFFKSHTIVTGNEPVEVVFTSSGTTGMTTSRHPVRDLSFYLKNAQTIFERYFGSLENYHFFALLPSYLERQGSSLIAMMDYFIRESKSPYSGFYLHNYQELVSHLRLAKNTDRKVILWGVSFALLDLAEGFELDLKDAIVIETGGMKGRRKEMIREELHELLCSRFKVGRIGSEYGMTELLSQAYSLGNGLYQSPPWMKILVRDINDPFQMLENGKTGGINVIDLANAHSCAFVETQDLGKWVQGGYFEVLGRIDNSDLRGCNLLVG
ncbi:MAG: acyl transferase [Cyclobacteriaceae bacterium]|nr:acyl transferase [Flammeovirgaceae bacterium]